jgi:hypothetical protein
MLGKTDWRLPGGINAVGYLGRGVYCCIGVGSCGTVLTRRRRDQYSIITAHVLSLLRTFLSTRLFPYMPPSIC